MWVELSCEDRLQVCRCCYSVKMDLQVDITWQRICRHTLYGSLGKSRSLCLYVEHVSVGRGSICLQLQAVFASRSAVVSTCIFLQAEDTHTSRQRLCVFLGRSCNGRQRMHLSSIGTIGSSSICLLVAHVAVSTVGRVCMCLQTDVHACLYCYVQHTSKVRHICVACAKMVVSCRQRQIQTHTQVVV